ncbi:MAG: MATE family efflux transporter, partial [Clostridium sp.]|nr:MATE family efflux transporter [Clostridium sp.]
MGSKNKIFETESIYKLLFMFALPAVFAILVAELYSMVDTFFVGRYVGPEAIGALTI